MSQRFLIIKQAFVEDVLKKQSIQSDIVLLSFLIKKIYPEGHIDTCSITEDNEWLIDGRKIKPEIKLKDYEVVYICIHNNDSVYDSAHLLAKAATSRHTSFYNATDNIFHHAERLAEMMALHGDISSVKVKIPHQIHVDVEPLNDDFISSDDIARKHLRNLFLPIHVMETASHDYLKEKNPFLTIENKNLANNLAEFTEHIDKVRHKSKKITFREHIKGPEVFCISVPHFRNQKIYTSLSFEHKEVGGKFYWENSRLAKNHQKEIGEVVGHVSSILFPDQVAVYALSVHPKRGVFVQYTLPLLHFSLQHPDFLLTLSSENGISATELFLKL